ncbi:MAG: NAD-dependent dihydropyrimidine dehydrogenase subunit PreA [Lentisphaerae bacterium]|nr:NAD-dependent dihydropyrimidine dehydrogenase subunit PreA [Lentisphaerota bacterium]MCP4101359.1 NAD-dependent dihydropyrimidine dehydrogenase subunit PreA [Lentisphaerota bacterium]
MSTRKKNLELIPQCTKSHNEKVAVIGSGPAGLTCAAELAKNGFEVTVFEKNNKLGGVLTNGITPIRLPDDIVEYEINNIKNLGVEFKTDSCLGRDFTIDSLRESGFKAFLISSGCQKSKSLNLSNSNIEGVYNALNYLSDSELRNKKIKTGKNVIIIGGGDVAIDCATTAKETGAETVTILYRRRLDDMPASKEELDYAKQIKIDFVTKFTPQEYIVENNQLKGIKAYSKYTDSEIALDTDMVIEAIGQEVDLDENKVENLCFDNKLLQVNPDNCSTSIKDIFAAGDITNGGDTVVQAVKEGKIAANGIIEFLTRQKFNKNININTTKDINKKNLEIDFCGVKCENPFFLSSSPVSDNYDMCAKAFESGWGGVVYKTIGIFIANECSPRFDNLRKDNTGFVGFKNMEQISDKPLEKNLEMMQKLKKDYPNKILVASIMGSSEEEWKELSKLVTQVGSDIIECNFSCPQMTSHAMGSDVGQNPELVRKYTQAVKSMTNLPVMAKMTPNIGNMEIPAIAALKGGADALAAINTIKSITGIDFNNNTCLPVVNGKSSVSGYSGKAIKPIALRFLTDLAKCKKLNNIPISGIGGIESWVDALEFFMVGASNLQVTTSVMEYGYRIVDDLITGVSSFLNQKGFKSLNEIIGLALPNIVPAEDLDRSYKILPDFNHDLCVGCGRCYISCHDGAHQAIEWDANTRKPSLNDNCVGCMLCKNVCPVENCITYGELKFKASQAQHSIIL